MPTKTSTSRTKTRASGARRSSTPRRRDAITLLIQDHREVEALFKRFERAGEGAQKQKRRLVDQMIEALSRHASIEEQILYPFARDTIDQSDEEVLEALEEHHVVKWLLWELEEMNPSDERFEAKVTVMMESVRHHVEEEESELFSDLRDVATRTELFDLADALSEAKRNAPTRPHPRWADTPPGNVVTAPIASVVDRARDVGRDVAERIGIAPDIR
jgi:hemerythrin-like domain-containing protein